MTAAVVSFRIHMMRWLRRAGFDGRYASATASREGLSIKGEKAGSMTLPWTNIDRGRVGYTETKYGPIYETRLWSGDNPPVRLFPYEREDRPGYAAAMRLLAQTFVERGAATRIELGISKFEALLGPVLMGIVAAMAFFIAGYAMEPPAWWHFIVIPLIPTIVFAVLTWQAVHVHWPRPLTAASDIERQLPR